MSQKMEEKLGVFLFEFGLRLGLRFHLPTIVSTWEKERIKY